MRVIKVNETGRRIGDSHPRAVLSDHEVDLLLELLEAREELIRTKQEAGATIYQISVALYESQLSYTQLGIKFEIHRQAVAKIARGERRCQVPHNFKHVPVILAG